MLTTYWPSTSAIARLLASTVVQVLVTPLILSLCKTYVTQSFWSDLIAGLICSKFFFTSKRESMSRSD